MRLQNRVAAVTGAAQGIGRAIAERLAAEGAILALLDRDGPLLAELAASLPQARAWSCDVRCRDQVFATFAQIAASSGPVEILINNAGIWRHTPVQEVEEATWDEVFEVNVKGTLWCSQAAFPEMRRRRAGKIVNIASVAGFGGSADWSAYCASKAAVLSLTLAWAEISATANVQVNAVCPGATQTPLLEQIYSTEPGSRFEQVHQPEEVAREVLKLICPFEQTTTAQVVAMKPIGTSLGLPVG